MSEVTTVVRLARYVERFQKIAFSRVYNEVASQPTVTSHVSTVRKALSVTISYKTKSENFIFHDHVLMLQYENKTEECIYDT